MTKDSLSSSAIQKKLWNVYVDNIKLSRSLMLAYKSTFWQRLKTWLYIVFLTPL